MSVHTQPEKPAALGRYDQLLAEAQAIKGVSLGKDAWRRLRRKRVSIFSLWILTTICLLAFFTPMLPLQAPRKIETDRAFMERTLKLVRGYEGKFEATHLINCLLGLLIVPSKTMFTGIPDEPLSSRT